MPNFHGVRFTNAHETLIWAQRNKGSKYTFNHHAMKSINDDRQMRSDWYLPFVLVKNGRRSMAGKLILPRNPRLCCTGFSSPVQIPVISYLILFWNCTTGAVAKKLGRHYIGIERNPDYIQLARERISTIDAASATVLEMSNPRQQKRVPFGILLETGLLQPGQMLYFIRGGTTAIIQADGSLRCGTLSGSIHGLAKILLRILQPMDGIVGFSR